MNGADDWQKKFDESLAEERRNRGVEQQSYWENPAMYMLTSGAFFIVAMAAALVNAGLWWAVGLLIGGVAVAAAAVVIARGRSGSGTSQQSPGPE